MEKAENSLPMEWVTSLHRIVSLPVNFDDPMFRRYPSLKLGVLESVAHYAGRVAVLAAGIVHAQADRPWVLSPPPFTRIPAAANLLCWQVRDILAARQLAVPVQDIFELKNFAKDPQGDPLPVHLNYSRLSAENRKAARDEAMARWQPVPAFSGASVLFVNDINVTGAQQRTMNRYFAQVGVQSVHWLYLIDVDRRIGKECPQLEHALNNSGISTFEAFSDVVCKTNIDYTSKCVWRLLAYDVEQLEGLFTRLPRSGPILGLT
jgi:hypothetical protein